MHRNFLRISREDHRTIYAAPNEAFICGEYMACILGKNPLRLRVVSFLTEQIT